MLWILPKISKTFGNFHNYCSKIDITGVSYYYTPKISWNLSFFLDKLLTRYYCFFLKKNNTRQRKKYCSCVLAHDLCAYKSIECLNDVCDVNASQSVDNARSSTCCFKLAWRLHYALYMKWILRCHDYAAWSTTQAVVCFVRWTAAIWKHVSLYYWAYDLVRDERLDDIPHPGHYEVYNHHHDDHQQ